MRTPRYHQIAEALRIRILAGEFAAGRLLPSESGLGAEYEASRVTIRRALEQLRDDGLLASRQGLGWYATADQVRQPLDELDTLEHQLSTSGVAAARQVLDFSFRSAPAPAAAALRTDRVLEVRRLNLADGEPFARVTVWCPETLGASLSRNDVEARPFYELLAETADLHLAGASQTIVAGAASADDAELLGIPAGSPVLICERVTRAADGRNVLFSEHVYPGHRMAFTVDLLPGQRSETPAGLRLVE
ncbi:MAG: GntR family transcriptional regulator [Actinomycetota bacterium]